jgi:hypothetical protein
VEAALALTPAHAATRPDLVAFALLVLWLAASGRRTRDRIERTAAGLPDLALAFGDEAATRARVEELAPRFAP